jgi:PilZ domain
MSPWQEEAMEERRISHRSRICRGGKILFNNRRSVLDCTIRNLSPGGACVQVENLVGVPATFDLLIDGEDAPRPCRLVWQSHHRAGVEFAPRQPQTSPSDPHHARPVTTRAGNDLRSPRPNGAGPSTITGRSRSW